MKFKKILAVVLASVMILSSVPLAELAGFAAVNLSEYSLSFFAKAEEREITALDETVTASGTCGENLTWVLYQNGTLDISGTGDMNNYDSGGAPWFEYRENIVTVNIADGVTSIGGFAFKFGCFERIEIPDSVTSIGENAFESCNIKKIELSNSLTSISDCAFSWCIDLESIDLPDSVISIGNRSFQYCTRLASIKIPDGVTSIGDYAFHNCFDLASIELPDSVMSIGNNAFNGCFSLASIAIPDSLTIISESAFWGCRSLVSIEIPDSVTSIGESAFHGCRNLADIELPDSLTSIGVSAFSGCRSLVSIEIPNSVTSISDDTFYGCDSLENIEIPDSVMSIGNNAFYGCDSLENIEISDSVTSIGEAAFWFCTSIKNINVAADNEHYASEQGVLFNKEKSALIQFPCASSITDYVIPDSVTSIGENAFADCTGLTTIELPDSITNISDGAFTYCISLTKMEIPNRVTSIGNYAFVGCTSLESIEISDSVTSIGYDAFADCTILASIKIPNSVTSIGSRAFSGCSSLASIEIPDSVIFIFSGAFSGCSSLANIIFLNPGTIIEYAEDVIDSGAVIYGYTGSTAQEYAELFGRKFVALDSSGCYHNYIATVTQPTCTEQGYTTYICSECDDVYIANYVAALEHDYSKEWTVDEEATCSKDGSKSRHCSRCDEVTDVTVIEKTDAHIENVFTQNASCTINGYTLTTCMLCGTQLGFVIIPSPGHSYGEWLETKAPTCTEGGEESRSCTVCGTSETQAVDALGHSYSNEYTIDIEATCSKDGSKSYHCLRCDVKTGVTVIEKTEHIFGSWYVKQEASLLVSGIEERKCANCTEVEQKEIPLIKGSVAVDETTGISVTYTKDSYKGQDIDVVVREDFTGSQFISQSYANMISWNIFTCVDGVEIQPDEPVLVKIPLPEGYNSDMIVVYHVNSQSGQIELMKATVIDGYICFLTSSFSIYIVVDESSLIEEENNVNLPCDHMCHKSGFMGIIWKIVRFFWKLFKMNPVCECGAAHY